MSKFSKHWWRPHNFTPRRALVFGGAGIGLLALLLAFNGFLARPEVSAAGDANIVILSQGHSERTIPTKAKTVGALLNKLGITIHKGDVVEPALSTRISQDKFRINIYRAVPVVILDGSQRTYTFSAAASPREVARQAGIQVYAEDWVTRGPVTNFAKDGTIGEKIVINRATPVKLRLYGHVSTVRTHVKTVGDLIASENITLHKGDTLSPKDTTPLTAGMEVDVDHKGVKYKTVTEKISAPVKYVADTDLSIGTSAVRQRGHDGKREVTYKIKTKNGKEVSRKVIQKVVVEKPVKEIIATGTAMVNVSGSHKDWMKAAGINPGDYGYVSYIVNHEGGWNPCKVQGGAINCGYGGYAGYGLVQATPGGKMVSAGGDWRTNPVTQLRWATSYANSRYGSWRAAYNHWLYSHNW